MRKSQRSGNSMRKQRMISRSAARLLTAAKLSFQCNIIHINLPFIVFEDTCNLRRWAHQCTGRLSQSCYNTCKMKRNTKISHKETFLWRQGFVPLVADIACPSQGAVQCGVVGAIGRFWYYERVFFHLFADLINWELAIPAVFKDLLHLFDFTRIPCSFHYCVHLRQHLNSQIGCKEGRRKPVLLKRNW